MADSIVQLSIPRTIDYLTSLVASVWQILVLVLGFGAGALPRSVVRR